MNTAFVRAKAAGILSVGERPAPSEPKFDDPYEFGRFRKPNPAREAPKIPTRSGHVHVRRCATSNCTTRQTNRRSERLGKVAS